MRERRERVDLTKKTPRGHQPGRNPAVQRTPDLMLADPVCCLAGEG
jgi:hypothetical protein